MLKSDSKAAQAGVRISSPSILFLGATVDHGKHRSYAAHHLHVY